MHAALIGTYQFGNHDQERQYLKDGRPDMMEVHLPKEIESNSPIQWKPENNDYKCFTGLAQYLEGNYPGHFGESQDVIVVYENGWGIPERLLNDYDMREALQMCDMCAKTIVIHVFPDAMQCLTWHEDHVNDNALRYQTYPSVCLISGIKSNDFRNPAKLIEHLRKCKDML